MRKKQISLIVSVIVAAVVLIISFVKGNDQPAYSESVASVPEFSGKPYVVIHDNTPEFEQSQIKADAFEFYSPLDRLGRCGYAMACVGVELMPTEDRGSIGQVKPSGWQTVKYDFVDGKYLYNRCHLIGFQLTGENANEGNLITGTRYMNVEGMLPFENLVADYVKETNNHVLYRVTPVFDGDNLVARGVQMEGWSVEDNGEGICFNVYVYNSQPGVIIDYTNGNSSSSEEETEPDSEPAKTAYIINIGTMKFHAADCKQGQQTKDENKKDYYGSREELMKQTYIPAGCCNP